MTYAFVSHATDPDAPFASRLADDLRNHDARVWIAPDSIDPGEQWVEAINRGLETCDTMLMVLTPAALESKWVRTEMNAAIDREHKGKMSFIPLDVEPCEAPAILGAYQTIRFRDNYEAGLKRLLHKLGLSTHKRGLCSKSASCSKSRHSVPKVCG